ncbi:unnamed protein product [Discula destructiva]
MNTQHHRQTQQMKASFTEPSPASALSILNPDPQRIPGPALLHHLVRNAPSGDHPALNHQAQDGTRSAVSYPELHARAEQTATRILAALPEASEKRQIVVPLLLPQTPELYISQLAVLKAGGAFCPLNLDAPPERVRFILGDVSARVVVTSRALRPKVDALDADVTVVLVDDLEEHLDQTTQIQPAREILPDSLAFLQFAAPTFDVSVFEIFFPLFRGVTLVSCNRADMLNDLPAVLRGMHVDACELTPTVAGSLLRTRDNAPELRLLLTIGEMLTEPVIREFGGKADRPSILWAMYGPTEATIHCTLQPACEASSSANNVGFPLDTVSSLILKPLQDGGSHEFEVLPLGEMGELAVGGHQTAVGYLNRPEQTAQVFIDTPYGLVYRTGDKARMTVDGTIECFGRISDGQVKLRGQRIELGEIEQAVLRTPGNHGAVAAVVQGIIVVFCERDEVVQDGLVDKVLNACRTWLPAFMVPGDVIFLEAFPRLPSGKIDRKKLKIDYETSRSEHSDHPTEFNDEEEGHLAKITAEALGVHLSSSSVLSAAGIDSLGAIKLASRLRQAGFGVSALDILSSKTLAQLRSRIQPRERSDHGPADFPQPKQPEQSDEHSVVEAASSLAVQADTIEAVVPCSPTQSSMLAETLNNPEAYCNWIELQFPETSTFKSIATWVHELAQQNEALRTGFVALEGKFRQVVWRQLDPNSISVVKCLTRRFHLEEQGFSRPFSVQILATDSRKHISVVLQIHHALYDGWSFDLLLSDLNLLVRGSQPVKRPSFRLLSGYHNSPEFVSTLDSARSFWAENLLGFQPTPMPQLLPKQAKSGHVLSAQRTLALQASAVQHKAAQLDISVQVVFQTCLIWLWGSLLGIEDVVIGNVTSGRTVPVSSIEEVVGPCLSTIPLRARLEQARTIKELLESVHASNRESLAHCTLPLAEIKKAAGIAPGQSLYEALFVFQESLVSRSGQQQIADVRQVAHGDYLETKLLVEVEPVGTCYQLRITSHADSFHYGYIQLLMRQFERVFSHMVTNTESESTSVSDCFSDGLLSAYNIDPKTLKGCPDLATLFGMTAARQAGKPAICFLESIEDETSDACSISYTELNTMVNRTARLAQSLGASEGAPVAIIMEKSVMLYVGILGILKAGCAYLPLLPSTPKARMNTILAQAGVRLCFSDEIRGDDLLELGACRFVSLRDARLENYSGTDFDTKVDPSRLANIIYTSGSTGVPKGVCVTQLNICSNLDVLSRIYPINENSRMLQACSQAFDVSVFEILFALTRGMCLCAATNDTLFADLEKSIRLMRVTHLSMTPTVASLVDPRNVPTVEFLVTSGEPMTSEVAGKWVGKLYQGYGPSETTNICSVKKMTMDDHIRHLGHSFENTSAFVLAPKGLNVLPIGAVGELCFGGDQVVAGYLNLPDTTKEKFVSHPRFGRIYRSGDIGRMLADGSLLIVGRKDDQVKLRGQRIELGEINKVVADSCEVSNSVTILVNQRDDSTQHLACFYVPNTVENSVFQLLPASDELVGINNSIHHTLRAKLPGYMIPSYLIPISTIPMTSSGKVDRKKLKEVFENLGLRQLDLLSANSGMEADGDRTEEERAVATVVATALHAQVGDVGRWTPLVSLGLDSISAISVVKGLQSSFSRRVPISAILKNSSVARLTELLSRQQTEAVLGRRHLDVFTAEFTGSVNQKVAAAGLELDNILPCTPLQEAMLASSASDSSYLNKMLFRLYGPADSMRGYWSTMFQRHGILRTCFFSTNDKDHPMAQCVLKAWEPKWQKYDVVEWTIDEAIQKHSELVPAVIDSEIPPVSLALITKGTETYLSFICHHALYDGIAISRLLQEVEQAASGVELPQPPIYSMFLRDMLALPESTDNFWRAHLEGFKPQTLHRTVGVEAGRGVLTRPLDVPFSAIDNGLKSLNVSLLSLLQSSWASLLHIILQSDDVCFGNVVNGRTGATDRIDELVAPCFNTIPTRLNFREHKRNSDVVRAFQNLNPELMQYQFTPLRRIQALLGGRAFDTLLLFQQTPRVLDVGLWKLERDDGEMELPLVCEVTPALERDELEVKLHFDRAFVSDEAVVFVHSTLSHIVSHFLRFPWSHIVCQTSLPPALGTGFDRLGLVRISESSDETLPASEGRDQWSDPEKVIRRVFSQISKVSEGKITRHTTIFQLGLDSINAVQVSAMLRKERFSNVTATDILENPTCSKLASKLADSEPSEESSTRYDLVAFQSAARNQLQNNVTDWDSIEVLLPCTTLQMGVLTEFMNSKGNDYLNFISFRLEPGITTSALKRAWVALTKAHPALRIGFALLDHEDASFAMLQYVFREDEVPVSIQNEAGGFDMVAWQDEARHAILKDLRLPPWQVRLVDGSAGVDMHLAVHHALYDAKSLHMILDDLSKVIQGGAAVGGTNLNTAATEIITQTHRCRKTAEEFWKKQAPKAVVNKFPTMTPLREDHRDIVVRSHSLSMSLTAVEEAIRNGGLTIQAVAQAAWMRILCAYLGESSAVFGTIFSGRNTESTRDAVFPCIITLPVIAQNSGSNHELLQAMMQYNTDIQKHQRTPLTDIQRFLDLPSTKLFDTLLVYQKFEGGDEQGKPWQLVDEQATVDYPISMEIEPQQDVIELRITFFSDVLPAEQAEIMLRQFDAILCDLTQHPDGNDDTLQVSQRELYAVIPAEESQLPSEVKFLHEFVEVSAKREPGKTALEFVSGFEGDQPVSRKWTYRELDDKGNAVANMLSDYVSPGDIVAVCFDKCPEAHFAMLGILKAGCALLALDPGAPASRKEFILRDSGAVAVLTDTPRIHDMAFQVSVPVIAVDEEATSQASVDPPQLTRLLTPEDRSYCLYTSGTTGTPKGCEITHENSVQALLAFQKLFDGHWDYESKWLQFASYHFDVSVLEQYWTWAVGITLVAAPRDVILEDLPGTISRLGITHIDLTPSLARLVHPDDVPSLCRGVFITGGEQLKQEILDVWGPKGVIWNFYGPTEATIGVTTYPCVPINGRSSNIGKQFANVGSYVLRPGTDVPVLRGGVGELCVSGKLVGKGYLNRDELTAERFPILHAFDERVYRTGDLVRVLHDGCFDFLGRADDQVKLRGQRLEIGEVNQCIRDGVSDVTDAVTLVIRNEKQQKDLLVSFVVAVRDQRAKELLVIDGDQAASVSQKVQRACRERLPGYMVPTYVLLLPYIPLSPNNKAEVKELRALFNTLSPEQLVSPSAPTSSELGFMGRKVCKALAATYGAPEENITPSTNAFELGVDSITVLRFLSALKRAGVNGATGAVILRNPTVGDLAHALQTSQKSAGSPNWALESRQTVEACQHRHTGLVCRSLGVTPDQIEYIAPCSALQQGMISRSRTEAHHDAYLNVFRYELAAEVELGKLRDAWEELSREHSVLRTKFVSSIEGFIQVALHDADLVWDELEVRIGDDVDALLDRRRKAWIERNSQIIEQPLELFIVKNDEKRLLVVHIFHAIYDANSIDLMTTEVSRRYQNKELEQRGPSFLDAMLHGPLRNNSSSRAFWEEHLMGTQMGPATRLSPKPCEYNLSISRRVPFDALDKVRKRLGATQQAVIQALWSAVLQQQFNREVTFGMIVSGRSIDLEDVDKTIGPLFNTVPYHHRFTQRQTWADAARQCHRFNTTILEFQHVALRDVQKWCSGGKPLFDTLFSFQGASSVEVEDLWKEVEAGVNPDYPLAFEAALLPEGSLQILIVALGGVADETSLEKMLDEFERAAGAAVNDPNGPVNSNMAIGVAALETGEDDSGPYPGTEHAQTDKIQDWTPQGEIIRKEISLLADIDEASISMTTSLLELGLDSIDTIKLSARLRRAGLVLSNSELIKGQTIAQFLITLQKREIGKGDVQDSGYASDVEEPSVSLQRHLAETGHDLACVEQFLPPTPLQDAMVSVMIQSEFQLYFNHDVLELAPHVDIDRLKQAWTVVIQHSPILRTTFLEVTSPDFDYAYAQVVMKFQTVSFGEVDVQSLDDVAGVLQEASAKALGSQGRSDLLQVTFAKTSQKTYVVLSIAHALYDGWSLGLLHQDVQAAYCGTYTPRDPYIAYLGDILRTSGDYGKTFWSDYISDSAPTLFPARHEGSASTVNRAELRLTTPASTLRAFCRRHAISQQAVAQACWAAVLATHCLRLDVTFGVVLSGRETEASEAMMFPTMNTVPVRAVFHGSVSNFLRYLQDNVSSVSESQHFPLRKIQTLAKHGQGQLFDTLFILQKASEGEGEPRSDERIMASVEGASSVEYPVCVEMGIEGDGIMWRTACDDRYLSVDETSALLRELETVFSFLVNSSEKSVLAVDDKGVSVCGLPAFQPREQNVVERNNDEQETDDAESQWSPIESVVRAVLAEFAGVELNSVTKNHNIYHLGLDSISAIKVSSALRRQGVAVSVRDLIQSVSIKDMAAKVAAVSPSSCGPPVDEDQSNAVAKVLRCINLDQLLHIGEVVTTDVLEILPATAMQTHMLSVWQNTDGEVFFPEFRYRLFGVNDRSHIDDAWATLLEEQCMLRTVFLATGSSAVSFLQVVLRPGSTTRNPFAKLNVQQDEGDNWLIRLRIHHALYDGVSLPLMMERFQALVCGDKTRSKQVDQSLAWRQLISSTFSEPSLTSRKSFWQGYLKGQPASSSLLVIRDGPAVGAVNSRVSLFQRAAIANSADLKAVSSQHGISIQAMFLAAYAKFLASVQGQEDGQGKSVVFGVYLANRGANNEELLYPTLALVPLRVCMPRESSVVEVAARIQHDLHMISDPKHVGVGLWEILEWTGVVIDSFVNFLSLPEGDGHAAAGNVQLREVAFDKDVTEVEQSAVVKPGQLPAMEKNAVRDAYPDAVDIEASMKPDGALDIGVFGSGAKLGECGAKELLQGIVHVLRTRV